MGTLSNGEFQPVMPSFERLTEADLAVAIVGTLLLKPLLHCVMELAMIGF